MVKRQNYIEVKIDGAYPQIDTTHVIDVNAPSTEEPFWTIFFKDGERINTTFPVLVHWKWEEVPNE